MREQLTKYHFVVGLTATAFENIGRVPFHTTVLCWDLEDANSPETVYRALTPKIRTFLEQLRGDQAC